MGKPLNEDVKNLRVEAARLLNERAERKSQYDALQEQLDTTSAALESNVQGLRRSAAQEAERYYKIDNDLISKEAILERTRDKARSEAYIKLLEGSLKTQEDRNRKLKSTLRQLTHHLISGKCKRGRIYCRYFRLKMKLFNNLVRRNLGSFEQY